MDTNQVEPIFEKMQYYLHGMSEGNLENNDGLYCSGFGHCLKMMAKEFGTTNDNEYE